MEFIMIIHADGNFAFPHIGLNCATSDFCVTPLNTQIQFSQIYPKPNDAAPSTKVIYLQSLEPVLYLRLN